MAEEIWKPIKGYELYYEVSNLGRIRALDKVSLVLGRKHKPFFRFCEGRIMTPLYNGTKGHHHYFVQLSKNNKKKQYDVHTLVAQAFLGPRPFDRAHIRHLNCDPSDNRVENLAYGSSRDNQIDSFKLDRGGSQKLKTSEVKEIRERLASGELQRIIAMDYGVSQTAISRIKRGVSFGWLE